MKKAGIEIQILFFILMGLIFVGILIFGLNKIFFVQKHLDEQERIKISNDLKKAFEFCNNPINSGEINIVKISQKNINGVCIIGKKQKTGKYKEILDLNEVSDSDENIVLFKGEFEKDSKGKLIINPENFNIIDTIKGDFDYKLEDTLCWGGEVGNLKVKIKCVK